LHVSFFPDGGPLFDFQEKPVSVTLALITGKERRPGDLVFLMEVLPKWGPMLGPRTSSGLGDGLRAPWRHERGTLPVLLLGSRATMACLR